MRVALVSRNRDKLRELRELVPGWELELLDTTGIPDETGTTFEENAREKARWGRRSAPPDAWVLGEDSGLCVDGLDGGPGIRSARYAGEHATDRENLERLLAALEGVEGPGRRARYVCELVLLAPDGREARGSGTFQGSIARGPRGEEGFGYDPVFVPEGQSQTVAELGDRWKVRLSHRAQAARLLARAVRGSLA